MKNKEPDEDKIREACSSVGQDQIFRFWKELNPTERKALLFQLNTIDFEESKLAWEDIRRKNKEILLPEPPNFKSPDKAPEADYSDMYEQGEEMLRQGKVAAFTVAGGQGTRLGHDGPKGTFCCTPITQKSLFEHFAQYMKFFSKRYGVSPRWFIMTSQENHIQTKQYFHANDYFGLDINRVVFFEQGMMPVFNLEGQILLKEKHQIAMSPNGHGGCLRALLQSAALDIMEDEGIDTISYFQIDNPMVYCLDPLFLGYHQATQSEMSSKAVQKVDGNEKVGTFIKNRKKLHVMEYSDISKEISHKKDNHGELCFRLGNIAIHLLNRDFVKNIATAKGGDAKRLRYHGALKKVSYLDDAGRKVSPKEPNAIKAETFVFDALPYAQNPLVLEIDRGEEFAPIKNAQGSDSLETSQNLQIARGRKWLKAVGLTEPRTIEISPTFAPTFTYFKEIMSNLEINNQSLSSNELYWDEYGPSPKPNNNQTKYK